MSSRRARLNLVTKTCHSLVQRLGSEAAAVARMATKCGTTPQTVRTWLHSAGKKRRAPRGENWRRLEEFYDSEIFEPGTGTRPERGRPKTARKKAAKRKTGPKRRTRKATRRTKRPAGSITITFEGEFAERVMTVLSDLDLGEP